MSTLMMFLIVLYALSGLLGLLLAFFGPYKKGARSSDFSWKMAWVFFDVIHPTCSIIALLGEHGYQPVNWVMIILAVVDLLIFKGLERVRGIFGPPSDKPMTENYLMGAVTAGVYGTYLLLIAVSLLWS